MAVSEDAEQYLQWLSQWENVSATVNPDAFVGSECMDFLKRKLSHLRPEKLPNPTC